MDKEIRHYEPPRPYARGARVGNLIFLSGEDGKDFATQAVVAGGVVPQAEHTFENIRRSLEQFGAGLEDIVKMTVYLIHPADRWPFSEVRQRYLPDPVPSTMVWVTKLAEDDMLVEVDVIAVVPEAR